MRKRTYLKLSGMQTETATRHLEEVRSIHSEMRGYKHDFHHHLQALRAEILSGDTERAVRYIDELDKRLMKVDTLIKTGNVALDAILSAKLAGAKAKGVSLSIKAGVPEGLTVSDVELSIIIGNLVDNAVEACASCREGQPFIRLYMGMKGKMLYFHMLNTSGEKKTKTGGLFRSGKTGLHGFGLKRAQSIIQEKGGWCKFNSEPGAFTSEFLLPAME